MSKPQNRQDFKNFCLRRLGAPVIKINLSEEQIDDAVDQALYQYALYHMDGAEKTYYKYQIQQADQDNGYIQMPENIIGAVKIFPVGQSIGTNSLFNMRYQFVINDLYNFSNVSLLPYYMTLSHVQLMEEMLVGQKAIRYSKTNNRLYIDMDWSIVTNNEWLIVEAYQVVDPDQFADVWGEKWLQDFATALMKKDWGHILSIYNIPMPGNMQINGQKVYADAVREIEDLKKELIDTLTVPPLMSIG